MISGETAYMVRAILLEFSERNTALVPGIYRHYRTGGMYRAIVCVLNTETSERMVMYTSLDNSNLSPYVRPLDMFVQRVNYLGTEVPRFQLITKLDPSLPYYPYLPKE